MRAVARPGTTLPTCALPDGSAQASAAAPSTDLR